MAVLLLALAGLAAAASAFAWLLCRAAAIADRIEPACCTPDAEAPPITVGLWQILSPEAQDAAPDCRGRHVFHAPTPGVWTCLRCGHRCGPQRATEVYDNIAIERLHADLAAFERGER